MLNYSFECPHCHISTRITERATVVRETQIIGFGEYPGGMSPEFSSVESFDDEPKNISYFCSRCEQDLGVSYDQLYDYVKEHGEITEDEV